MKTVDHQEAFKALMALPVDNPERPKLSVLLPYAPKTLASRTRKFLTKTVLQVPVLVPIQLRPVPSYADWLKAASRPRPLRADPPKIPAGDLTLDRYITEFDSLNGLRRQA